MIPLLVIDMQPLYLPYTSVPAHALVHHARREIMRARRRRDPVLFVEMQFAGDTDSALLDAMPGPRWIVTKNACGVGAYLSAREHRLLSRVRKIRVAGVYANQCVRASVKDLLARYPNVSIQIGPIGPSTCDPSLDVMLDVFDKMERVSTMRKEYNAGTIR